MAGLILFFAVAGTVGLAQTAAGQALPESTGVEILRARCLSCHDSDLIAGQRLGEAGWGREIDKMIRWGARVQDTERAPLQAYLSRHFTARPMPSDEGAAEGASVFDRACLVCHGADLVESQGLSSVGWTREVEKMIRWGARVDDADRASLVAFLASRFAPR
ncbi:MAG: hypothetical protein OEW19_04950 [Acidobacteriota bacterium]|nr:hypothetical protein [Acidobacteriota bacterium]